MTGTLVEMLEAKPTRPFRGTLLMISHVCLMYEANVVSRADMCALQLSQVYANVATNLSNIGLKLFVA